MNRRETNGHSVTESLPKRYYQVVSYRGSVSGLEFETVQEAAEYAKECWPDQEQDPDRTGKGWDIQVCP